MIDLSITAAKIQNARKEKGFTQEELAGRLGISAQAVSKWERALSLPDVDLLLDISKVLDIEIAHLLDNNILSIGNKTSPPYDFSNDPFEVMKMSYIEVNFSCDLVPVFSSDNDYIKKFTHLRNKVISESGVLLPIMRFRDSVNFETSEYTISIMNHVYSHKKIELPLPEIENLRQIIYEDFYTIISENLVEFMNRHTIKLMLDNLRYNFPFVVDGVIPERISITKLKTILKKLVKDKISIVNLMKIVEFLDEQIDEVQDNDKLYMMLKETLT